MSKAFFAAVLSKHLTFWCAAPTRAGRGPAHSLSRMASVSVFTFEKSLKRSVLCRADTGAGGEAGAGMLSAAGATALPHLIPQDNQQQSAAISSNQVPGEQRTTDSLMRVFSRKNA